jgi:hypothetical protein
MTDQRIDKLLADLSDSIALLLKYCNVDEQRVREEIARSFQEVDAPDADGMDAEPITLAQRNLLGRMLTYWRTKPAYVDDEGTPSPLHIDGEAPSLTTLLAEATEGDNSDLGSLDVNKCAELLELGQAVARDDDGAYYPIKFSYLVNTSTKSGAIANLAYLTEFAGTCAHNAYKGQGGRFLAVARVQRLPEDQFPMVQAMLDEQGYNFLTEVDAFIESKKTKGDSDKTLFDIGVGMYLLKTPHNPDD